MLAEHWRFVGGIRDPKDKESATAVVLEVAAKGGRAVGSNLRRCLARML